MPKIVKGGQKYYILYLPDVSLGNPTIIDEINAIFNNNSEFVQYLFRNNPQPTELGNTSMGDITRGGMVSFGTDEPGDPAQIGGKRLDLKTRRLSDSKEAVRTKIHDMNRKNSSQSQGARLATRRFYNIHTFIGNTNTPTNPVEHYIYNSLLPDYLFDNINERIPIEHDLIKNITFLFSNNLSQLEIIEADGLVREDIIRTLEIKTYVDTIFLMYYTKNYNYEEVFTSLREKERIYIIQEALNYQTQKELGPLLPLSLEQIEKIVNYAINKSIAPAFMITQMRAALQNRNITLEDYLKNASENKITIENSFDQLFNIQ